jgi:hypothetical protein
VTQAWLDVSVEVLIEELGLPHSCNVLEAQFGNNGVIALLVEDPTIHPDAMRVSAIWGRGRDGGRRFQEWKITAKRDPALTPPDYSEGYTAGSSASPEYQAGFRDGCANREPRSRQGVDVLTEARA